MEEKPYLIVHTVVTERKYNPNYGDDRICVCGHTYYRHFDWMDNNYPAGCKYCNCHEFEEDMNVVAAMKEKV